MTGKTIRKPIHYVAHPAWAVLIAALLFPALSFAQSNEPPRYEVELIVFRHTDQSRNTPEAAALPERIYADLLGPEQAVAETLEPQRTPGDRDRADRFTPLAAEELRLGSVIARLRELDAYTPLLHDGWAQLATSTNEAVPNRITMTAANGSRLTGSITLYKQRFLHLNLDLALELPGNADSPGSFVFGDAAAGYAREQPSIRLQESRRVRSDQINYFDHPQLGVLVTIREVASEDLASDGADG